MYTFAFIFNLFIVSTLGELCADRSEYCRYLKNFCKSDSHKEIVVRECRATCGFCSPESEDETARKNTTSTPLSMRSRRNDTATTPKKCVYPKEKMITLEPINGTEITFSANLSVVQRETVQTMVIQISNATSSRKSPPIPDSNEVLRKLAESKRNSTLFPKKVTLSELVSAKELELPRITTAKPSTFSVSLSKTLIKGKCFDEYTYCREFATLCTHPGFGDVMASHCTLTCGRCDEVDQEDETEEENCSDESPDCTRYADVCHLERYHALTKLHCAKTCGHCKPTCRDRHQNCDQFAIDGFCSDGIYTEDERKYLCGATCKMC